MKIRRKGAAKTPKSLLAAASEVFAEKGYRDATIAEICERAKANVAAVNYHFGDKETLYTEAWRHSFSESVKAHPPDGGVSDSAPPEKRLRGQVVALLRRIADEGNNWPIQQGF
jgi:AcrR family transcriptional regulator